MVWLGSKLRRGNFCRFLKIILAIALKLCIVISIMKNAPDFRPNADIPNQAGFVLILVRENGIEQMAKVMIEPETGCHYCANASGQRISLSGAPRFDGDDPQSPVIGWREYVAPKGPDVPRMACSKHPHLRTRDEIARLFQTWECTERIPAKGKAVFINFGPGHEFPLAVVNVWPNKSAEGKTLFAVWFYQKIV